METKELTKKRLECFLNWMYNKDIDINEPADVIVSKYMNNENYYHKLTSLEMDKELYEKDKTNIYKISAYEYSEMFLNTYL